MGHIINSTSLSDAYSAQFKHFTCARNTDTWITYNFLDEIMSPKDRERERGRERAGGKKINKTITKQFYLIINAKFSATLFPTSLSLSFSLSHLNIIYINSSFCTKKSSLRFPRLVRRGKSFSSQNSVSWNFYSRSLRINKD